MDKKRRVAADQTDSSPRKLKRTSNIYDEFTSFVQPTLDAAQVERLRSRLERVTRKVELIELGKAMLTGGSSNDENPLENTLNAYELSWNERLVTNMTMIIEEEASNGAELAEFSELVSLIGRYIDVSMLPRKKSAYRIAYASHVLNHIIRTRNLVLSNKKLLESAAAKEGASEELIESTRDQGFARPTVVILAPFKSDAYALVQLLKKLVFGQGWKKAQVLNNGRFEEEFRDKGEEGKARRADEDFNQMMEGNTDDCFRVGIGMSRKSLKLFVPFEKADILLCSPLGLRMCIDGDSGKESHLLSSIQILIIDRAHILLHQNWEHLTLIMKTMHSKPTKICSDLTRLRGWVLEGQGREHCQTLLFSEHRHEQFSHLFQLLSNHRGALTFQPPQEGHLLKIEIAICQELHKISVNKATEQSVARFNYFKEKVYPHLTDHTVIFISSYFDYVKLRNFLKKENESFVQCYEYATPEKVYRARDMFFHGKKKLLLLTERFHFFYRYRIRGMKKLVFYQAPSSPSFYPSVINMAEAEERLHSTLLFTPYDKIRMENIFGFSMGNAICKSDKQVQVILSEV